MEQIENNRTFTLLFQKKYVSLQNQSDNSSKFIF